MKLRKLIKNKTAKFDQRGKERKIKEMEEKTERSRGKLMYQRKREKGEGKEKKENTKLTRKNTAKFDKRGNEKTKRERKEKRETTYGKLMH